MVPKKPRVGIDTDGYRLYWVALNLLGLENLKSAHKALGHYHSAGEVFGAPRPELEAFGFTPEAVRSISSKKVIGRAEKELRALAGEKWRVVALDEADYPEHLREIYDPPLVLYYAGPVEVMNDLAVAVVGSRRPTPYGRAMAEKLASDLAARGVVIVSGLARGIDSSAHRGALKEGKTVAVLGSGLDIPYPRENRGLFREIAKKGAAVTEYPLTTPPLGHNFPLRNRIISGLSTALVVVEASSRSGSLISAQYALDQNREVMAVPGNATSELSRGTNDLIRKGAKLVESWEDVAEEIPSPWKEHLLAQKDGNRPLPLLDDGESRTLDCLPTDAVLHIDEVVEKTEASVPEALATLLSLELKGLIVQSPGKYFRRRL